MQTINEDIKNGTFKPVYLLYGEEAFLKQSYKKKLRAAIKTDCLIDTQITLCNPMTLKRFEGKAKRVQDLRKKD